MASTLNCDLVVAGSGAGGMAAAIAARKRGLDVIMIEKEDVLGGTTAISGGWIWIPGNHVAGRAGVKDSIEAATRYLQHEAGQCFDPERAAAFLEEGPRMVDFFADETLVRFTASPTFPDYHPDAPGGSSGRSLIPVPFDARELGQDLAKLRRPLRQTTLYGLNVGSGTELTHFFNATRSLGSAAYVLRRMLRHGLDTLRFGRGMTLANGNALTARLLKSALDGGVRILLSTSATRLQLDDGAVRGIVATNRDGDVEILARRGVVLACGGLSHDLARRRALFSRGADAFSMAPTGNTGDGVRLGESAGGAVEGRYLNGAAWVPVSILPDQDGRRAYFPHVVDRAKPGVIAVTGEGRRFVNEAVSYHDFVQAMFAACPGKDECSAFVVCDHRAIRRYGLGHVKPFPMSLRPHLRSGYLVRGRTAAELARAAGIEASGLERTIAEFNAAARSGRDSRFGKGATAYNRFQGDLHHLPNACIAPLAEAPFYAIRIFAGDLGTFAGLKTDRCARVVDAAGGVVPGLYAVGCDMASIFGGNYSGAGINIGPAMTFGYIAGCHASRPERAAELE